MMKGERPAFCGSGTQSRDFMDIEDVTEVNLLAAEADLTGEVLNVGSGVEN
jgi:nucleoside-diphosphate-sugar epimerase